MPAGVVFGAFSEITMKQDSNEILAVQQAAQEDDGSATWSASLTMENDSRIVARIDELRRIDGSVTAEDVRKVFQQFKVQLDDWVTGEVNFELLAKHFNDYGEPSPIPDVIMDSLRASRIEGKNVFLPNALDRKDYVKVNDILVALGGKWNKGQKAHVFADADPEEAIANFMQTGKLDKAHVEKFGFFPMPEPLARFLVSKANLKPGMLVLELSAGVGNLAKLCAEIVGIDYVACFEIQERNCKKLQEMGFEVEMCDFMETVPTPMFDAVVMNPPFEKQRDVDHCLHAYRFLKPGGTLAAIMSASVLWRSNKKTVQFRKFLDSVGAEVVENAADAFKESGTLVRTITISLTKPMDAEIEVAPVETPKTESAAVQVAEVEAIKVDAPAADVTEAKAPVIQAAPKVEEVEQFGFVVVAI